ncbi:MAG: 6-phosphofructokinase [Bacillota bacterium]
MKKYNMLVAHGGGPTAVINSSLQGVIEEAMKQNEINNIYGARFGIEGILAENFINLGTLPAQKISALGTTPSSAIGSCRRKLTDSDLPLIFDIFRRNDIRYFLYNGGNDSMDSCDKISRIAEESGYELNVIGIPKTIDNDLELTDHSPGYGSAARYIAVSLMELACDVESLPIHVCIAEVMGRNAGWLAAAASFAVTPGRGPHLIYLPERVFNQSEFLEDVQQLYREKKGVLVVVSEGLRDSSGKLICDSGISDGFGHRVPGGTAQTLSKLVIEELGIPSRSEKPGLLGRASIAHQSAIDRREAYEVGSFAVKSAVKGHSGYMVSLERLDMDEYKCTLKLVPLDKVANKEKKFPLEWINKRGNGIIKEEFEPYALPLLGQPLPEYVSL